jgi:cellulose synthase/poly-beta-1,6-N-acetylglucosamine synthase-like glycosyltransferase
MAIMASYLWLCIQSYRVQNRLALETPDDATVKYMIDRSPLAPSVSIIAPAYNEEVNIITNVKSLLSLDYPNYEIIIVNDGSKDKTLQLLIDTFEMETIPYNPIYKVPCKPITELYRSRNTDYSKLVVVNKVNGGRKSDSSNAGINVCKTDYFICTDADCIVEPMALYRMMWPVMNCHETMIGVSGTMLMSNDCDIPWVKQLLNETETKKNEASKAKKSNAKNDSNDDGIFSWFNNKRKALGSWLVNSVILLNPLPKFQQLEYLRSFLIGKLGWSSLNALPNISGGFGLFNTEVAIKSGGYDNRSMAEDVDMLLRMVTYMKNHGSVYRLAQVPQVCCWTKGPETLKGIFNQRSRWARGLFEIVVSHFEMFFNRHYGIMGTITLPYIFVFEFLAGAIEFLGYCWLFFWLIPTDGVNWDTFFIILGMVYLFSLAMAFALMFFDYRIKAVPWKNRFWRYCKFFICSILEPLYHLCLTFISMRGYIQYLLNKGLEWKTIER